MESDAKAFKIWLKNNEGKLEGEHYTTDDIGNLAIACGFDRVVVAQWISGQKFKEAI